MSNLTISNAIAERLKQIAEREKKPVDTVLENMLKSYGYYQRESPAPTITPIDEAFNMPSPQEYTFSLYRFRISHTHLQIQAYHHTSEKIFYLIFVGLQYISAPTSWLGATLYRIK